MASPAPQTSKRQTASHATQTPSRLHCPFIRNCTLYLCAFGAIISMYALYVEVLAEKISDYKALCDINHSISCSKVFTSRYGRGFGLVDRVLSRDSILNQPNSVFGLAFYVFQATLAFNPYYPGSVVQLVAAILANIGSVYLGCILYFVLEDFCVVCVSIYVVNFLLLLLCIAKTRKAYREMLKKQR